MQSDHADAVDAVDSLQRKWSAALRAGDVPALVALYTADAQLFGNKPDLFTGHSGVRRYFEALPPGTRLCAAFGVRNVSQPAQDVIVSAGYVSFSREGVADSALAFRITFVLARREGEWRIASHHASLRMQ
jgi:uncharacterized protein (TIGR02246 family)